MTKIILISGFLGAGKTSLIMNLAKYLTKKTDNNETDVVIIENEIGEVAVDDSFLGKRGLQVRTIVSGCICCTLSTSLIEEVRQIVAEYSPSFILLESTRLAIPGDIKANLEKYIDLPVTTCTVIDAQRWNALCQSFAVELIKKQLYGSDFVLFNKCDLISAQDLDMVIASVNQFNQTALQRPINPIEGLDTVLLDQICKGTAKNESEDTVL